MILLCAERAVHLTAHPNHHIALTPSPFHFITNNICNITLTKCIINNYEKYEDNDSEADHYLHENQLMILRETDQSYSQYLIVLKFQDAMRVFKVFSTTSCCSFQRLVWQHDHATSP